MTAPRAKLMPHNPNAVIQTSTGWVYPDGTFKPFYTRTIAEDATTPSYVKQKRKWWPL